QLPPPESVLELVLGALQAGGDRASPQQAQPRSLVAFTLADLIRRALQALGVPGDADALAAEYGWGPVAGVALFADALPTLEALRARGLKLGSLSNAIVPGRMRDVEMESFGLCQRIDVRLTSADVGFRKPHRAPFDEIARR